ncbi:MAG: response regulator [Vicinamibacterales bacterium]
MRKTLLLADDSPTIHRVVQLTFADEPFDVICASGGREAIERLATLVPDVVLADVSMPGCDGYDLCAYVRTTPGLAHVPVALLTGAFEPIDERRAEAAGCDSVVAKPFEPQALVELVRLLASEGGSKVTRAPVRVKAQEATVADGSTPSASPDERRASDAQLFDRLDAAFSAAGLPTAESIAPLVSPPAPPPAALETDGGHVPAMPTLGDVFRAILSLERGGTEILQAPGTPVVTPALLDDLTRRVVARMQELSRRDEVAARFDALADEADARPALASAPANPTADARPPAEPPTR